MIDIYFAFSVTPPRARLRTFVPLVLPHQLKGRCYFRNVNKAVDNCVLSEVIAATSFTIHQY